jgi:hypothetical protein
MLQFSGFQRFSKCGPWANSISMTLKFVRNETLMTPSYLCVKVKTAHADEA